MKLPDSLSDVTVQTALTSSHVSDYLRNNPEFWVHNTDLLAEIVLPHNPSEQTVSLVERQVSILRKRSIDAENQLNQLLENARNNDILFEKTKRLTLSLLNTRQLNSCIDALFCGLKHEFDIHFSQILLTANVTTDTLGPLNNQARLVEVEQVNQYLPEIFNNRRPLCGQFGVREREFIFPSKSSDIGSIAIAPLHFENRTIGIIAIANRDPNFYRSSANTLFLSFVADVLSRLLVDNLPKE